MDFPSVKLHTCITSNYYSKISPVQILFSIILTLMFLGFWGCSDYGKQIIGGCSGDAVADSCGVCDGDGFTCNISYSLTIQPIFTNNCSPCHTSESSGNLNLSTWENTVDNTSTNGPVINNEHDSSLLWQKINNGAMPPSSVGLSTEEIFLIATWIDEGALDN